MKKLLNLSGVHILTKSELKEVKGSWVQYNYCKGSGLCCFRLPNGGEFCDAGYCQDRYFNKCVWA